MWSALTGKERAKYVRKFAEQVAANADEIVETEVVAMGKPRGPAHMEQTWAADYLDSLAVRTMLVRILVPHLSRFP